MQEQLFVCYFCGKVASVSNVNDECKVNKTKSYQPWCRLC